MPLTPQDVVNKQFGRELRGYNQAEVDEFLDVVEQELVRLLTENATVQQQLAASKPPTVPSVPTAGEPPTSAPIAPGEPQEAALRTLLMAQRTADQAIAEARAEADALLAEAKARQSQIDSEINARTANAMAELEARRGELEARIEDLRAFEREYRLRLKAYLEGQLKELQGRPAPDDGPGAGVPAAARTAAITPPPMPAAAPPVASPGPAPELPQVQLPAEWAELHEGPETTEPPAPGGPPREALPPTLRAVPPLSTDPEPLGPFTVVPPPVTVEQVDDGPEPPAEP
jgi:DivIVA domain-containing protein